METIGQVDDEGQYGTVDPVAALILVMATNMGIKQAEEYILYIIKNSEDEFLKGPSAEEFAWTHSDRETVEWAAKLSYRIRRINPLR